MLPNVSKQMAHQSAFGSTQKACNHTSQLMEQTWFMKILKLKVYIIGSSCNGASQWQYKPVFSQKLNIWKSHQLPAILKCRSGNKKKIRVKVIQPPTMQLS